MFLLIVLLILVVPFILVYTFEVATVVYSTTGGGVQPVYSSLSFS